MTNDAMDSPPKAKDGWTFLDSTSLVLGTTGQGKSVLSQRARIQARENGHLLVDIELFRNGGLLPLEYEYARRIQEGIDGLLPRGFLGKPVTIISDIEISKRTKPDHNHTVTTKNQITLSRKIISEAKMQLESISGIWLNQNQMIELLEDNNIDEMLFEFGEAETSIRESLAEALSMKLLGRSWPTYGSSYNKKYKSDTDFSAELNKKAQLRNYKVTF